MAFTQIPWRAHSMAKDLVSDATAALLAEYAATSYSATNDESEAMFTMRPYRRSIMWGANTWQASKVPVRFVSRISFHSDLLTSSVGVRLVFPAQFTSISTLPNDAITASRNFAMLEESVTSQVIASEPRFRRRTSSAASVTSFSRLPVGTTLAPASANPFTSANPMPEVPPITTAVLPLRSSCEYPIVSFPQIELLRSRP